MRRNHAPMPSARLAGALLALAAALPAQSAVHGVGRQRFDSTWAEASDFVEVRAGGFHTLARRTDGSVVAWGAGGSCAVPPLPAGLRYTAMAAGYAHSLLLRSDGQVVAFGSSQYGQTAVPTLPPGVTFTAVAAGGSHSAALRSDGAMIGWGSNSYGQLIAPTLPTGLAWVEVQCFGSGGRAEFVLPLPNLAALRGAWFFAQALVVDPAAGNGPGAVLSEAAAAQVGG